MQGPKQWVTQERRRGDGASGRGSAPSNGDSRRRSEPAATDTTLPGIADAVCPGMADGLLMGPTAAAPADLPATMNVPVASNFVMAYPYGYQSEARVCYGAYVALAHMYGVPSQRGLRDYWRHVYLFRERALAAAQVIEGGPARSLQAAGTPGALDSQATLMSLTSHQSFTVCGSTATAGGSRRGGSGACGKAATPSTATSAGRASDTIIGPIAVAAGKAFRGSPDSHNSEADGAREDYVRVDNRHGADVRLDEAAARRDAHMHAHPHGMVADRRSRVMPSREARQEHRVRDSRGRDGQLAAQRRGSAEHAGHRPGVVAGFHAVSDTEGWGQAGGAPGRGHSAVPHTRQPASRPQASGLQFERPRMHVTNKGSVAAVAHSWDAEPGPRRRGAAESVQEDFVPTGSALRGGVAGSAPVAAWLRDHAVPRAAGVMAENTATQRGSWESCGDVDGLDWAMHDAGAQRGRAAEATGTGEGSIAIEIQRAGAAGDTCSDELGQVCARVLACKHRPLM